MPRAALLLLLLLTGRAHATEDSELWRAAYALDKPAKAEAAEATLRKGGAAAYEVLMKLARVNGEERALALAGGPRACMMFAMHAMGAHPGQSALPEKVAKLALKLLVESPELRKQAEASQEPFDRAMSLLAAAAVPDALPGAVERLRREQDPWLLLWADSFVGCAMRQPGAGKHPDALTQDARSLSERARELRDLKTCQEPSELDPAWVDRLAQGSATASGWSRSNDELRIPVRGGPGESLEVAPGCALALYEAVAERGRYLPGLLVPVATEQWVAMGSRKAAGLRAVKDLEHYPKEERNRLAAKLVNAGFTVPVKVTFQTEHGFLQEEELEAAARQGNPDARAAILQTAFCRDASGGEGVALLGFVKGREAADTAFQLARRCPRARARATAALLRLKDRRAVELLGPALDSPGFGREHLQRALVESLTPQVAAKLRALAAKQSPGAEDTVRLLKAAQVMRE